MTEVVAVDIGGTNARFALARIAEGRVVALTEPVTLPTAEHAGIESAWAHYRTLAGGADPRAAAIAIAAPLKGDAIIQFTNNPWTVRPATLAAQLGVERVLLVNDFAAVAHAVAQAGEADLQPLCGPDKPLPDKGVISIVGPGTGLGVAFLLRDGEGGYHVQATEGGHIDFAPRDGLEDRLLQRLRRKYRRVSVERLASGPAIVDIYETLAMVEGHPILPAEDRDIWARGLAGSDPLAAAAIDRFCLILGGVAGDIALAHGAGAVVIGGGLGQRIRAALLPSGFAARFTAKGRFEAIAAAMPVKIITHPQPGLLGAAAAFARDGAQAGQGCRIAGQGGGG